MLLLYTGTWFKLFIYTDFLFRYAVIPISVEVMCSLHASEQYNT
jgi:hypothetical protein